MYIGTGQIDKTERIEKIQNLFGVNLPRKELFPDPDISIIKNSQITYITGPSGSGKSSIGRLIKKKFKYETFKMEINEKTAIIDNIGTNVEEALYYLNSVGLAEAYIYLTPYELLSTGQKFRFYLALILASDFKHVIIDEYAASLDAETSYIVSYSFQKALRRTDKQVVIISNNDMLQTYLRPDVSFLLNDFSEITVETSSSFLEQNPFMEKISVEEGQYSDVIPFEKYHYFSNPTESLLNRKNAKYYVLKYREKKLAILITASPYPRTITENSLLYINNEVRLLYRIIVHPKIRGIGVTKILFDYVKEKESAIFFVRSAMALSHPFLERLGFDERSYHNYALDDDYKMVEMLLKTNSNGAICEGVKYLANLMYRDYLGYMEILKVRNKNFYLEESFFLNSIENLFQNDNESRNLLLQSIKPVDMKEFCFDNRHN